VTEITRQRETPQGPQVRGPWAEPLTPDEISRHLASYITEALHCLHVQAALFCDEEWLRTQAPNAVATAHGVLFEKLSRPAAGAQEGRPGGGS
jgi:hypothetical protein